MKRRLVIVLVLARISAAVATAVWFQTQMRRFFILALILYATLDFADPLKPNTVEFEPDAPDAAHRSVPLVIAEPDVTAAKRVRTADLRPRKLESRRRSARVGHALSDWLTVRQAHAPAPPPRPSEDH